MALTAQDPVRTELEKLLCRPPRQGLRTYWTVAAGLLVLSVAGGVAVGWILAALPGVEKGLQAKLRDAVFLTRIGSALALVLSIVLGVVSSGRVLWNRGRLVLAKVVGGNEAPLASSVANAINVVYFLSNLQWPSAERERITSNALTVVLIEDGVARTRTLYCTQFVSGRYQPESCLIVLQDERSPWRIAPLADVAPVNVRFMQPSAQLVQEFEKQLRAAQPPGNRYAPGPTRLRAYERRTPR